LIIIDFYCSFLDDQLLIRRILNGDAEAYRLLYRNYAALAWHVAISVCKNHLWAEEAVQSAFISAYQNLSHFRSDSSFKTWLLKIVFHQALRQLKSEQKRRWQEIETSHDQIETDNDSSTPFSNIQEKREAVQFALQQLSEKENLILSLFYLHELSLKETAQVTGFSEANVKVLLHRARKNFRNQYDKL
jgi:RNA polymerase sigma factor (sigma-70 family)